MSFSRFIAIDWSGAQAWPSYRRKIQLAECRTGRAAPRLIDRHGGWRRLDVLDWLLQEVVPGPPALIGFDFSFAPPYDPEGGYLPGDPCPATGPDFWRHVDALSADDPDLGAASFLTRHYRRHFYFGSADGPKAPFMRPRLCEVRYNMAGGRKPSSVFDAIGAAQVAKASFAGMRLLGRLDGQAPIWPFQAPQEGRSAVVEIYCQAFIRHAGEPGRKLRRVDDLNRALSRFSSDPVDRALALSDDETDALVSAAGLRALHGRSDYWRPPGLSPVVAATEGWTFGVL